MIWTLPDGTLAKNSAAMKQLCSDRGLDWSLFRRREQKGLARRAGGPRQVRLPDDWRARLDAIFGAGAVLEFVKEAPIRRPAIVVAVNALDTKWAQALGEACAILFLVRGRINYVDVTTGEQLGANPKGTALYLFADDPAAIRLFCDALRGVGSALHRA